MLNLLDMHYAAGPRYATFCLTNNYSPVEEGCHLFSPGQSFLPREILAVVEPVNFLPVFLLAVFIAIAHEMTFGATFEHGLKIPEPSTPTTKAAQTYVNVFLPLLFYPSPGIDVSSGSCGTP